MDRQHPWGCRRRGRSDCQKGPDEQKCPQTGGLQLVRILSGKELDTGLPSPCAGLVVRKARWKATLENDSERCSKLTVVAAVYADGSFPFCESRFCGLGLTQEDNVQGRRRDT